jgi:cell division protein FtsQ
MVGNKRISNEALNTWIGTIVGRNIFQLNLDEISQRLTEHPWVQSASVGRVFPQAIYIELKERTPFAKIQLENIYVMDNYGVLLGTEVDSQNKLPTITGIKIKNAKLGENIVDKEIIDGLKMMHSLNQLSMFEEKNIENVHISSRSRMIFSTHNQDTKIHIRPEIAQESFKNLVLALDAIQKNGQDLSYIDLSFKNKIILNN